MNYAIETLEKEKQLLISCLTEWELDHYPDVRKERSDRLKALEKAIEFLNEKL